MGVAFTTADIMVLELMNLADHLSLLRLRVHRGDT